MATVLCGGQATLGRLAFAADLTGMHVWKGEVPIKVKNGVEVHEKPIQLAVVCVGDRWGLHSELGSTYGIRHLVCDPLLIEFEKFGARQTGVGEVTVVVTE
jgi:hypothetical protein